MNNNQHGFRVATEDEDEEWFVVHQGAPTNMNPGSLVEVVVNTRPICLNMTNKAFRREVMRARDIGVELVRKRMRAVTLRDEKEQEIDPTTLRDAYIVRRPDGELAVRQIDIELGHLYRA